MPDKNELEKKCIDTIRFLAADAVEKAKSGHPGMALGAAPMAFALWTKHLKHNPEKSRLAGPGPVYSVGRSRLDAVVRASAPDRL